MSQIVFLSMQHPDEMKYKFATPSTMKPTQISCSEGAVNQIPAWVEMKGSTLTSEVVRKFLFLQFFQATFVSLHSTMFMSAGTK